MPAFLIFAGIIFDDCMIILRTLKNAGLMFCLCGIFYLKNRLNSMQGFVFDCFARLKVPRGRAFRYFLK